MDIRDISIGDWVQARQCKWDYEDVDISPPAMVIQLEMGNDSVKLYGGGFDFYSLFDDLQPIPITPEILLKNGFKEHIFPDQYINAEKCTIVRAGKEWDFNSAIEEYRFIGKYQSLYGLQFVHELQHALRVAGITREFVV